MPDTANSSETANGSATPAERHANRQHRPNSGAAIEQDNEAGATENNSINPNEQRGEKRTASDASLDDLDASDDEDAVFDANPSGKKIGTEKIKCEDHPFYEPSMKDHWTECRNLQRAAMLIHMDKSNRDKIIKYVMNQWKGTPGDPKVEKKRAWAIKEAGIKYDNNYATWKSQTFRRAKKRISELCQKNSVFETLTTQKQVIKFFKQRWDRGVGLDEFIEIFHWIKEGYNLKESSPTAKAWCKNMYVCVMNMCKMQREMFKKHKGRPPVDDKGRHEWDNEEIFGLWGDMTEGAWPDRPKFTDFAAVVRPMRTRTRVDKRPRIDPKLNPKIYNPALDDDEDEEDDGPPSNQHSNFEWGM